MNISQFINECGLLYKRWFHKRNIIIMSEKGVKHVPINGNVQFALLIISASFICWASYSTGSYMAAREALKEQSKALRSVTSAHVNVVFDPMIAKEVTSSSAHTPTDYSPKFILTPLESQKMGERLAYLESKVSQLQNANAEIIQHVQKKTNSKIDDLKSIIKQTGLNSKNILPQAKRPSGNKDEKSQGGPYIPADMIELKKSTDELFSDLDELSQLRKIVSAIPLGSPMRGTRPQSNFGYRHDPFTNRMAFHSGIDLSGPRGAKIYSTANGIVVKARYNRSYGNVIDIDHGNGITTRYAHLSKILVKAGQSVNKGDVIGIQGSTGRSTGAHLHYEVRYNKKAMNPKNFLKAGQYVSQE